jgi:hypothetical protein
VRFHERTERSNKPYRKSAKRNVRRKPLFRAPHAIAIFFALNNLARNSESDKNAAADRKEKDRKKKIAASCFLRQVEKGSFRRLYLLSPNQANAQLSTGPTSAAGKAKSSLNAVKTGLTGRTVLLPSEDAALYEQHLARFVQEHAPVGDAEQTLVQSLADTQWRLLRIPSLEAGIYALGRLEFADLFANEDESVRTHLISAKTLLVYQRQLNNLNLQENRLRRQRENDTGALRELQESRKQPATGQASAGGSSQLDTAASLYAFAVRTDCQQFFDPKAFGFEFSVGEIKARALQLIPGLFADRRQHKAA